MSAESRTPTRLTIVSILLALAVLPAGAPGAAPGAASGSASGWMEVDYRALVDTRRLTHSGESIGMVLHELHGRPYPQRGESPDDATAHVLLDPLLEPYAFVLADALDTIGSGAGRWVEIGSLWAPAEAQPAWAELLRARRFLVESDGTGKLRVCLPWRGGGGVGSSPGGSEADTTPALPSVASDEAAKQAWEDAWPVLRHVFAAERRRLAVKAKDRPEDHPLDVEVHPYVHLQARTLFHLGVRPYAARITATANISGRPPVDLESWQRFLDRGLQLEGGRLEADGTLRLLGSEAAVKPTLLGRPLVLADFAVAYRAVSHGGLGEPYMSLDRGASPQTSIVNYGGRLRDTSLGLVSLLCDARFKTFSLGIDVVTGLDQRDRVRRELPEFRTHQERFAANAGSKGVMTQQTRLWFYPDTVDLTLSREGDVLVIRRARMSAASERVQEGTFTAAKEPDPPWTAETVAAINRDYDPLARFFPELGDLDQVVRLLSFFTWLRAAGEQGQAIPDLDALLALELPAQPTPRTFPQLLAFSAIPPAGSAQPVTVYNQTRVGEALDRLQPASGAAFPADRRLARARAALDPQRSDQAALARELEQYDPKTLDDSAIDLLAYRAERLRMHQLVLGTLPATNRDDVEKRKKEIEGLRTISTGIGGLDLGMSKALARAAGRGAQGAATTEGAPERPRPRPAGGPRPDPPLPAIVVPPHGVLSAGEALPRAGVFAQPSTQGVSPAWVQTVAWADGPEPAVRRVLIEPGGRASIVERLEGGRFLRYRMDVAGSRVRAQLTDKGLAGSALELATDIRRLGTKGASTDASPLPPELGTLDLGAADSGAAPSGAGPADSAGGADPASKITATTEPGAVRLHLHNIEGRDRSAAVPRPILQRVVLGRDMDLVPDRPLPGLTPASSVLGSTRHLMVLMDRAGAQPPWAGPETAVAGEEDAARLASGLRRWWTADPAGGAPSTVVGVQPGPSTARWLAVKTVGAKAFLLLPEDGFPGASSDLRARIAAGWKAGESGKTLAEGAGASLVVIVSAEDPALLGARLRELAHSDAMKGRLLAVWPLAGPIRGDLPASLLAEGRLAAIGIVEYSPIGTGRIVEQIAALGNALGAPAARQGRPEDLPGPLVWFY